MSQREYEEINAEHLADKFAVRCGAGGDLSSGLNKILQLYGVRSTMTMTGFVINEIITGMVLLMMSAFYCRWHGNDSSWYYWVNHYH